MIELRIEVDNNDCDLLFNGCCDSVELIESFYVQWKNMRAMRPLIKGDVTLNITEWTSSAFKSRTPRTEKASHRPCLSGSYLHNG